MNKDFNLIDAETLRYFTEENKNTYEIQLYFILKKAYNEALQGKSYYSVDVYNSIQILANRLTELGFNTRFSNNDTRITIMW